MATRIWPSENSVFDVPGGGRKPTEENLTDFANSREQISLWRDTGAGFEFAGPGGVVGGWDFVSGDATSFILTNGIANIRGYRVEETANTPGVLVANSFNYIFLTLDTAATLATGLSYTVVSVAAFDDDVTIPADSILLFVFETGAATIVNQFDFRAIKSSTVMGHYIGDGAATRFFDLGFRPKMVEIVCNEVPFLQVRTPYQWPRDTGVQRGIVHAQANALSGFQTTTYFTNDFEVIPELFPNGFRIEDGPGTMVSHRTYIEASKVYQPPGPPLGVIVDGAIDGTTMPMPGAAIADFVMATHSGSFAENISIQATILAPDVVSVNFLNTDDGAIQVVPSGVLKAACWATNVTLPRGLNENGIHYYFLAWF